MVCQPDQTYTHLGVWGQYVIFLVMIDVRDYKSVNLQYITLGCLDNGTNKSNSIFQTGIFQKSSADRYIEGLADAIHI